MEGHNFHGGKESHEVHVHKNIDMNFTIDLGKGHNMDHSGHSLDHSMHNSDHSRHSMDHSGHSMNHSEHSLDHSMHSSDHSGHSMDHSGHSLDHSGHNLDHSGHSMDHSGMVGMKHDMAGMHAMHFTPNKLSDFLFKGVTISSIAGIVITMLLVMIATMILEGCNVWLHNREHVAKEASVKPGSSKQQQAAMLLVSSVLKVWTVALGYLVMLSVMSMNLWLFISAILGSGLGHFFIRPLLHSKLSRQTDRRLHVTPPEVQTLNVISHPEQCDVKEDNETTRMLS